MTSSPTPAELHGNVRKVLLLSGAFMFLVLMPVLVPFYQSHGLSMAEVFQVQTVYAVAMVSFEVPSGYASDLLGRKRCLVLASACYGAAFTWLALSTGYWDFMGFAALSALATSLRSGTDVALLYDSLEAQGEASGQGSHVLGRRLFWSQSGETSAAFVATACVAIGGLALPPVVNAVTSWAPLLISLTLVEPPRATLGSEHGDNLRLIARELFWETPRVRQVLLTLIAYGLATLLAVWSIQDYWRVLQIPLEAFGLLWAGYNLLVALAGRAATRLRSRWGVRRVVLVIGALPILGYLGFAACAPGGLPGLPALAQVPLGVWVAGGLLSGCLFQLSRGLTQVVLRDELNQRVAASFRATANSVSSLGVRLAFAGFGPLLGWSIDGYGHAWAFAGFAAIFLVVALVFALPLALRLARGRSLGL